jgi:copper oxidase (laccase) domain-containing protein
LNTSGKGLTPAIDVASGVVSQLRANDVAVQWVPGCTRESERLYSYRRDGQTGRFAGVVQLVGP